MCEGMYFTILDTYLVTEPPLCYQCFYTDGAILCIYHYYYYSSTRHLYAILYVPKQHVQGANVAYAANLWKKNYYYYYYYWGNKLKVANEIEKAHFETSFSVN